MTDQKSPKNIENNEVVHEKKKSIQSMTDDEIIEENLKEILEKKSREERKANGRLVAVIVAFLVIFLAIYHAWIRNTAALAGVLVPAGIMVSYGGWVVILAKRDKQRRAMFEKHIEEVAAKNKSDLDEKATKLHFENELASKDNRHRHSHTSQTNVDVSSGGASGAAGGHRKHRKHRNRQRGATDTSSGYNSGSSSSSSSRHSSSHHATKDLRAKRPSIRQKLFRQNAASVSAIAAATTAVATTGAVTAATIVVPNASQKSAAASNAGITLLASKKKRLQRLDALSEPQLVRMSSAP